MTLNVVVASRNPVKLAAVKEAFAAHFPDADLSVRAVDANSGVGDQPTTDDETRRGARNRAADANRQRPDADYWVGLEGGIETLDGRLMAFAWIAVRNRSGDTSDARSATLPLPPAVAALIDDGLELGEANDRVFSTVNSKQAGGAYGLLTDGRYTREGVYCQTVILALVPFVHAVFRETPGSP